MQGKATSDQHLNRGPAAAALLAALIIAGIAVWYSWMGEGKLSISRNTAITVTPPPQPAVPSADEKKAINLVTERPEVQVWLKLFSGPENTSPTTKGKAVVEVDHTGAGVISVHVFEAMSDHSATFGWYSVDSKTWEVTKDL